MSNKFGRSEWTRIKLKKKKFILKYFLHSLILKFKWEQIELVEENILTPLYSNFHSPKIGTN